MKQELQQQLGTWLLQDKARIAALETLEQVIAEFNLQDCWVAAGFVRNLVWDKLHHIESSSLNDVDVIHFNTETDANFDQQIEQRLYCLHPAVPWSVKNQARMHIRNGDKPYQSSLDAMSYWPEKETAVAVRYTNAHLEFISAFDLSNLLGLTLTYNPKRSIELFNHRVISKGWLQTYPKLTIVK